MWKWHTWRCQLELAAGRSGVEVNGPCWIKQEYAHRIHSVYLVKYVIAYSIPRLNALST